LKTNIEQPERLSIDRVKTVIVPWSDENTVPGCQLVTMSVDLMQTFSFIQAQHFREFVIVQTIRLFPLELHSSRSVEPIHLISLHQVRIRKIS